MSNCSRNPASPADYYIGSLISLTSKHEIRYEGIMYYLNPQDSTFALKNVRSFGTEGRKKDGPQILPSDKVYEYILFRGADIKDLQVKYSPVAQLEETLHDDPAIIQSHCDGDLSNSSKSFPVGGSSAGSGASHDISTPNVQPGTSSLLPQQSGSQVGPLYHHSAPNVNAPSHALPMSWSGYSGFSGNNDLEHPSQYTNSSIPEDHNMFQTSSNLSNTTLTSPSNFVLPESKFFPSNLPPSMFVGNRLSPSLVSSSSQDRNSTEASSVNEAGPGYVSFHPVQSPYPVSSVVNSSRSLLNHPPRPITPDQISQPRATELPPSSMFFIDQGDVGAASSASSNSSLSITSPADQPPLLPLPPQSQKLNYSPAINEEFDFESMNEKFKKDELWGYLGRSNQAVDGVDDSDDAGQKIGEDIFAEKVEAKPAYKKDDFFDSISCNSLSRGANNGHRFSERRKLDIETFGTYQQRFHPNLVAKGTRRGQYSRGMGHHHYGVRGRGHYTRT